MAMICVIIVDSDEECLYYLLDEDEYNEVSRNEDDILAAVLKCEDQRVFANWRELQAHCFQQSIRINDVIGAIGY